MQQEETTRSTQFRVSSALAVSDLAVRGGSSALAAGGHSIADMAQRDLDAALQLLADRAQYITGANGAAIALRREGKKDMLCRASTGSNVPGLGALLSTEFGLSGESVRTRQPMRCDDAARDARVNPAVCREMGIASVAVMPVVNDDEVLGVFELFSGKVNAFGERDLSALQRLSGMVETAVRLARASVQVSAGMAMEDAVLAPKIGKPGSTAPEPRAQGPSGSADSALEVESAAPAASGKATEAPLERVAAMSAAAAQTSSVQTSSTQRPSPATAAGQHFTREDAQGSSRLAQESVTTDRAPAVRAPAAGTYTKALFWSAATVGTDGQATESDQSHVPPGLRKLRKCQACGFPVSSERILCVECEEKKWRGQLQVPKPIAARPRPEADRGAGTGSAAAAAPAKLAATPADTNTAEGASGVIAPAADKTVWTAAVTLSDVVATQRGSQEPTVPQDDGPILSGGLAPSESWFAANKYILGAVIVVAAVVVAILFCAEPVPDRFFLRLLPIMSPFLPPAGALRPSRPGERR